jgi:hypothetical protein
MVRENLINYIGLRHDYSSVNCITIIDKFFKTEFDIYDIEKIIPANVVNRRWMREISLEQIDEWALQYGIKVPLTEAQDFDVMVFRSNRFPRPIHFGMFIKPCHMLHLEEGSTSRYESISNEWRNCLYAIYRHKSLV